MLQLKKTILATLFCFLSLALFSQTATAPAAGNGTASHPYQIATLDNLYWLSQTSSAWASGKYFVQTGDIDATATATWFSNGSGGYYGFPCIGGYASGGNQVFGTFRGSYDGQGYTLSNLYISRAPHYVALFGSCTGATIKNLNLKSPTVVVGSAGGAANNGYNGNALLVASGSVTIDNVHITNGKLTANTWHGYIGGMLGRMGAVTATNCSVNVAISATTTYAGASGGFIGYSESSTSSFINCSSSGSFTSPNLSTTGGFLGGTYGGSYTFSRCYSSMSVSVANYGGGFAGQIYDAACTFNNCYARGAVTSANAGGFYGYTNTGAASVVNCYATGAVSGTASGGFGGVAGTLAFSKCFWDTQTSGKAAAFGSGTHANVVGKTTTAMKTTSTFTGAGWDFVSETANGTNNYWFTDATYNNGYPSLVGNIRVWKGGTSSNWTTAANWQNGILPSATSIVKIGTGASFLPAITAAVAVDRLDFNGISHLFDLGNYTLTCNKVLGFGSGRYIRTSGAGVLKMTIGNADQQTFPVGNTTYNPVAISNNSGSADAFTVKVLDEVYVNGTGGATLADSRVQRSWDIGKANSNAGSGVDFVFTWNAGDVSAAFATPALYHYSGGWSRQTGGAESFTANTLTYKGYTGTFSPFAVMDAGATLPVNWLSFTAARQGSDVALNWSTASERATKAYTIQHSTEGRAWKALGTRAAAGNSSRIEHYSFVHTRPARGANYYRLVQEDIDGQLNYSSVASVAVGEATAGLLLYPNPVQDGRLAVRLANEATVQVLNGSGIVVLQQVLSGGTHVLPVAQLPRGLYTLKAGTETKMFVIQ